MSNYFCYIHRTAALVPEMRVLNVEGASDLPEAVLAAIHEWPRFDFLDIYDDRDQSVLRVMGSGRGPS